MKTFFIILLLPVIILWKIIRLVVPELTSPFDSLAEAMGNILRIG